jgi:hypothetical protein
MRQGGSGKRLPFVTASRTARISSALREPAPLPLRGRSKETAACPCRAKAWASGGKKPQFLGAHFSPAPAPAHLGTAGVGRRWRRAQGELLQAPRDAAVERGW